MSLKKKHIFLVLVLYTRGYMICLKNAHNLKAYQLQPTTLINQDLFYLNQLR